MRSLTTSSILSTQYVIILLVTISDIEKCLLRSAFNRFSLKFLCEHLYLMFRGNHATNYGKEKEVTTCNKLK